MAPDTAERSLATVRRFMAATGAQRRDERRSLLHGDFVVHEAGGLPFSGDDLAELDVYYKDPAAVAAILAT
jgi:hypothetical protein